MPDLTSFRSRLNTALSPHEKVIADSGYRDDRCLTPTSRNTEIDKLYAVLRARHGTVNKRLKNFSVLCSRFRDDISKHSYCFHATAQVTQLIMDIEPLFFIDF